MLGVWRCVDHTIELAVHDAYNDRTVQPLFERIRNQVRFIRASSDRRQAMRDIQAERLHRHHAPGAVQQQPSQAQQQPSQAQQQPSQAQQQPPQAQQQQEREQNGDDDDDEALLDDRDLYLPRSPAEYRRQQEQKLQDQAHPWNLILDVATRWSSTFAMVERFAHLFEDLLVFAVRGGFDDYDVEANGPLISLTEWSTLKTWADALAPVADFVRIGEGERYCTMAWICPLFKHVLNCVEPQGRMYTLERRFRQLLFTSLNTRLGFLLSTPNMALATAALHPAFARMTFVPQQLREEVWIELLRCCREFGELNTQTEVDSDNSADSLQSPDPLNQYAPPTFDESRTRDFLWDLRMRLEGCTKRSIALSDMIAKAALSPKFHPLRWWKGMKEKSWYESVIHIARIMFCTPATSAPSERIFSGESCLVCHVVDNTCLI